MDCELLEPSTIPGNEQRRDIIASQDDNNDNLEGNDEEEISIIHFIENYFQLIENENDDQIDKFLILFSEQLDSRIFAALEKEEEDLFQLFSTFFFQQLSSQTSTDKLLQYLQIFHKLQNLFRSVSYYTLTPQNLSILFNFFDIENHQIKNELILIFGQYLPVNYNVYNILIKKAISLLQLKDITICHSLLNFINKYLIELKTSLSNSELLNIIQILTLLLEQSEIDTSTIKMISFILKNILNTSLNSFLSQFDLSMINFIEKIIVISLSNQDIHSCAALANTLESILILTSNRIPTFFSEKVNILFENFNLSIFIEIINKSKNPLPILSVQCICNFILAGFANRVLSLNDVVSCFLNKLENGDYEIKEEIILCLINLLEKAPLEYKSSFLSNRKILSLFVDVFPTLHIKYVLNFLKSLYNELSQCTKIANFADIKNAFLEAEFLNIFESLDCEVEGDDISEIQPINELFQNILS